jgi:hypothetical protein
MLSVPLRMGLLSVRPISVTKTLEASESNREGALRSNSLKSNVPLLGKIAR